MYKLVQTSAPKKKPRAGRCADDDHAEAWPDPSEWEQPLPQQSPKSLGAATSSSCASLSTSHCSLRTIRSSGIHETAAVVEQFNRETAQDKEELREWLDQRIVWLAEEPVLNLQQDRALLQSYQMLAYIEGAPQLQIDYFRALKRKLRECDWNHEGLLWAMAECLQQAPYHIFQQDPSELIYLAEDVLEGLQEPTNNQQQQDVVQQDLLQWHQQHQTRLFCFLEVFFLLECLPNIQSEPAQYIYGIFDRALLELLGEGRDYAPFVFQLERIQQSLQRLMRLKANSEQVQQLRNLKRPDNPGLSYGAQHLCALCLQLGVDTTTTTPRRPKLRDSPTQCLEALMRTALCTLQDPQHAKWYWEGVQRILPLANVELRKGVLVQLHALVLQGPTMEIRTQSLQTMTDLCHQWADTPFVQDVVLDCLDCIAIGTSDDMGVLAGACRQVFLQGRSVEWEQAQLEQLLDRPKPIQEEEEEKSEPLERINSLSSASTASATSSQGRQMGAALAESFHHQQQQDRMAPQIIDTEERPRAAAPQEPQWWDAEDSSSSSTSSVSAEDSVQEEEKVPESRRSSMESSDFGSKSEWAELYRSLSMVSRDEALQVSGPQQQGCNISTSEDRDMDGGGRSGWRGVSRYGSNSQVVDSLPQVSSPGHVATAFSGKDDLSNNDHPPYGTRSMPTTSPGVRSSVASSPQGLKDTASGSDENNARVMSYHDHTPDDKGNLTARYSTNSWPGVSRHGSRSRVDPNSLQVSPSRDREQGPTERHSNSWTCSGSGEDSQLPALDHDSSPPKQVPHRGITSTSNFRLLRRVSLGGNDGTPGSESLERLPRTYDDSNYNQIPRSRMVEKAAVGSHTSLGSKTSSNVEDEPFLVGTRPAPDEGLEEVNFKQSDSQRMESRSKPDHSSEKTQSQPAASVAFGIPSEDSQPTVGLAASQNHDSGKDSYHRFVDLDGAHEPMETAFEKREELGTESFNEPSFQEQIVSASPELDKEPNDAVAIEETVSAQMGEEFAPEYAGDAAGSDPSGLDESYGRQVSGSQTGCVVAASEDENNAEYHGEVLATDLDYGAALRAPQMQIQGHVDTGVLYDPIHGKADASLQSQEASFDFSGSGLRAALQGYYVHDDFAEVLSLFPGEDPKHVDSFLYTMQLVEDVDEVIEREIYHKEPRLNERKRLEVDLMELFDSKINKLGEAPRRVHRVLVVGAAGVGKSCLSMKLAYRWATGSWGTELSSVFLLPVRALQETQYDGKSYSRERNLATVIVNSCFLPPVDEAAYQALKKRIAEELEKPSTLVILDGLDERAGSSEALLSQAKKGKHKLLMFSRPCGIEKESRLADTKIELTGLSDDQRSAYVRGCFPTELTMSLNELIDSNSSIAAIARVPVNLQILCFLWRDSHGSVRKAVGEGSLPGLYRRLVQYTWERYIEKAEKLGLPTAEECASVFDSLGMISMGALSRGAVLISEELVRDFVPGSVSRQLKVMQRAGFLLLQWLDHAAHYQFPHSSFQDYFAGRFLAGQLFSEDPKEQDGARAFFEDQKLSPQCKWTLTFMAGEVCKNHGLAGIRRLLSFTEGVHDIIGVQKVLLQLRFVNEYLCSSSEDHILSELPALEREFGMFNSLEKWFVNGINDVRRRRRYDVLSLLTTQLSDFRSIAKYQRQWFTPLLLACRDEDQLVRWAACRSLGDIAKICPVFASQFFEPLLVASRDEQEGVRCASIEGLASVALVASPSLAQQCHEALLRAAINETEYVRSAVAFEALVTVAAAAPEELFPKCLVPLLTAYRGWQEGTGLLYRAAERALKVLARATPEKLVDPLVTACMGEIPVVRQAAYRALGDVAISAPSAADEFATRCLDSLFSSCQDGDWRIQAAANYAIVALGSGAPGKCLGRFLLAQRYGTMFVRSVALEGLRAVLGKSSEHADQCLEPILFAVSNERDWRICKEATLTLGKLSASSPNMAQQCLPSLLACCANEFPIVRQAALTSVGNVVLAVPHVAAQCLETVFRAAYNDESWHVRHAAIQSLGDIASSLHSVASDCCEVIMDSCRDEQEAVRCIAIESLGRIAAVVSPLSSDCLRFIQAARGDMSFYVRKYAVAALREVVSACPSLAPECIDSILAACRDESMEVRFVGHKALVAAATSSPSLVPKCLGCLLGALEVERGMSPHSTSLLDLIEELPLEVLLRGYWAVKDELLISIIIPKLCTTPIVTLQSHEPNTRKVVLYTVHGEPITWNRPEQEVVEFMERINAAVSWEVPSGSDAGWGLSEALKVKDRTLFNEYIAGGCRLGMGFGIDFTRSNGNPEMQGTPHFFRLPGSADLNDYEQAITAFGSCLGDYQFDAWCPVWGFGAKFNHVMSQCFQCGPGMEVDGVQGILDAYKAVFYGQLVMSGPTQYSDVIGTASSYAWQKEELADERDCLSYTVFFILTTGDIQDMEETRQYLINASCSPLSVVFVGIGKSDFGPFLALEEEMNNASFIPFVGQTAKSLHEAVVDKVAKQVVRYYEEKGISPKRTHLSYHSSSG